MPFKSKSQQKACYASGGFGSGVDCAAWSEKTTGALPERVGKKKKIKKEQYTWGTILSRDMFFPFNEDEDFDRWTGTERAMISKHPDKFSKEACKRKGKPKKGDKMCPYAISASMEKKGAEPHYKKQETSKKGTPKKKEKYKNEDKKHCNCESTLWDRWVTFKENNHVLPM